MFLPLRFKKTSSNHLPFKKRFVFFETVSVSTYFPIHSFESKHDDCESEIDCHFRHKVLEDEPEDDNIQSSKIVGIICDQSNRSNVYPTPSKEMP